MNRNSKILLGFLLMVIGVVGIMFTPSIHSPMNGMIRAMTDAQFPPGLEATRLPESQSREVNLLSKYCTQCHGLPGPGMHTVDDWPQVVERMSQYMQTMHSYHVQRPSDQEMELILSYLQRHAQTSMEKSRYPDLDTAAGIAFLQTCSRCHSTPDPKQHTRDEWPAVVQRMVRNMEIMGKKVPEQNQLQLVDEFLQRHAK